MSVLSVRRGVAAFGVGGAVWTLRDGAEREVSGEEAETVRLSDDASLLAVAKGDTVRLLDANDGRELHRWRLRRRVRTVRFRADGRSLTAAERGGDALSLEPGREPRILLSSPGMLLDAALSPREDLLLACDRDERVRVCRFPDVRRVRAFCAGHAAFVARVQPLPHDARLAVTASGDCTVKVWEAERGRETASVVTPGPARDLACGLVDTHASLVAALSREALAFVVSGAEGVASPSVPFASDAPPLGVDCDAGSAYALSAAPDGRAALATWRPDAPGPASETRLSARPGPRDGRDECATLFKREADGAVEYRERKRARTEERKSRVRG